MMSVSAHALPGTRLAGLKTTQFPNASAGAIFQAGMAMGKFQGVTMPTTPTGSRVISTLIPGRTDGTTSPVRRKASPAKNLNICPARPASPIASGSVLPSSRASRRPSSTFRARISVPIASSTSKPLLDAAPGPAGERLGRGADRALGIRFIRQGILPDHFVGVRGIDVPTGRGGRAPLPPDKVLMCRHVLSGLVTMNQWPTLSFRALRQWSPILGDQAPLVEYCIRF